MLISSSLEFKVLSESDLLNSKHKGLDIVSLQDFNILWLMQSGPTALFTGITEIMSKTFCSRITRFGKLTVHLGCMIGSSLSLSSKLGIEVK